MRALPLLVLGSAVLLAAAPSGDPAGNATHGKQLFMSYGCYECHGTLAQGNYFGAPHLAPHPLPYAALVAYIRKPTGQMPSYSAAILPDKDAADIYAYLASIPAGKSAAAIPALEKVGTKPQ